MKINSKQLSFAISRILSYYQNRQMKEFETALDNFNKNYYLQAKEEIGSAVDKEKIIYCERIIDTYNIFYRLLKERCAE